MDKRAFRSLRARVLHIFNALCRYLCDALPGHGQRRQTARPGCHRCSAGTEFFFDWRAPSHHVSSRSFYRTHHFAKSSGSEEGAGALAVANSRRDISHPADPQAATLAYAHSNACAHANAGLGHSVIASREPFHSGVHTILMKSAWGGLETWLM